MHLRHCVMNLVTAGLALVALPASAQAPAEPAAASVMDSTLPAPAPAVAPTSITGAFEGMVSYYGAAFAGRKTANGERFVPDLLTMAHKTLRFGTLVRVTNLHNNLSVIVRVNDRGPFVAGRVGDVSAGAARLLGMLHAGVVHARLEVLGKGQTPANP
jgi:rare lipoprotein A